MSNNRFRLTYQHNSGIAGLQWDNWEYRYITSAFAYQAEEGLVRQANYMYSVPVLDLQTGFNGIHIYSLGTVNM